MTTDSSPTESSMTDSTPAHTDPANSDRVEQDKLTARLRRIEGQIRGITRMLEEDRACEDVVTQLMAVRSSIDTVGAVVLDSHLANCIDASSGEAQVEALRSSMRLWWRFAPSAGSADAPVDEAGAQSPLPVAPD
jgi:DNA-binding FrmR family transcriptional regulator